MRRHAVPGGAPGDYPGHNTLAECLLASEETCDHGLLNLLPFGQLMLCPF